MSARKPAPDQRERDAAIAERRRNVLVDAGAGTGKTTILVDRLVEMVAPTSGAPPVRIGQIAAITFTRKAAGDLRLRIRERLLQALAEPGLALPRTRRLQDALAGLDTAYVGTIHSFADRLLRLRPVAAGTKGETLAGSAGAIGLWASYALNDKLERVVVPLFYRDRERFIDVMRHAIVLNGSFFNAQRMMLEYVTKAYVR